MNKADRFAARLKQLREAAGWTQRELADRASLSLGAIQDFEQQRSRPSWDSVLALADALGVEVTAFLQPAVTKPAKGPGRPARTVEKPEDKSTGGGRPPARRKKP